ncbi:MAG: hypothetical protein CVV28_10310 [Methanobacteriales archaeon HGW-Methanobacteriales-1]|jgi:hypothetical protein|nr:MAG: hypothetical protein CVV28_10310 [Methanobacteriales archaeon HGW-Methanobacteriales-1]
MRTILKVFLLLMLVVASGATALFYGLNQTTEFNGNYNILLLAVDTTENQGTEGLGACDMAYVLNIVNGSVKDITPIYPGGMTSPTYTEPSQLGSGMLLLHDSLYGVNTTFGAERAQEIVEYNKGLKTNAVVMITPDAVDALLTAVGPIEVNGAPMSVNDSLGYIRDMTETDTSTENRGNATSELMEPVIKAAKSNPATYINLARVAIEQYNKGNIRVVPASLITKFTVSMGLNSLLGR